MLLLYMHIIYVNRTIIAIGTLMDESNAWGVSAKGARKLAQSLTANSTDSGQITTGFTNLLAFIENVKLCPKSE